MMAAPVVCFFSAVRGIGTTSLLFNVGWMASELGHRVLFVDLDPQAGLTSAFLPPVRLERNWSAGESVRGAIVSMLASGRVRHAPRDVGDGRFLLAGDIMLAFIEDELADAWQACLAGGEGAFHLMSVLWRVISTQAEMVDADIVLVDTGPTVGALNRVAVLSADHIVFPIAPGLAGRQALAGVGSRLRDWRTGWQARLGRNPDPERIPLPGGNIRPTGYVVLQRGSRAVSKNDVAAEYRASLIEDQSEDEIEDQSEDDESSFGVLKGYGALVPIAREVYRPIFALRTADGVFGGHQRAVQRAFLDYRAICERLLVAIGARTDRN